MFASAIGEAVGGALPAALGVALSPIPIIAVILMLGTPRARTDGPAFAIGWVAGLVAVSTVVLVVTGMAGDANATGSTTSDSINWTQVGLGVLLLALAHKQWRKRPAPDESPEMPKWMATIDSLPPGKALGAGAALSGLNPKNLILTLAAASSIAQVPDITVGQEVVAVAVFVAIGSVTVVGSVLLYLVGGDRATKTLAEIKAFMSAHNAAIMTVIFLLLGAKLLGDGLGALS